MPFGLWLRPYLVLGWGRLLAGLLRLFGAIPFVRVVVVAWLWFGRLCHLIHIVAGSFGATIIPGYIVPELGRGSLA